MSKFTKEQKVAIEKGAHKRARLVRVATKAVSLKASTRNVYIYSPPGIGKTHSINEAISKTATQAVNISGNISMFAFGLELAVLAHVKDEGEKIIINVDDCDELFKNEMNINVMKNMLDVANPNRSYNYSKKMVVDLTDTQQEAVDHFSNPKQMGFRVPVSDFVFVITSNSKLPTDDEVKESNGNVMASHKNAIRSRCQTSDFDLESSELWGWIADVVMNTDALKTTEEANKVKILKWLFTNWDNLTERSIRTVEKMALLLEEDEANCVYDWEIDFTK